MKRGLSREEALLSCELWSERLDDLLKQTRILTAAIGRFLENFLKRQNDRGFLKDLALLEEDKKALDSDRSFGAMREYAAVKQAVEDYVREKLHTKGYSRETIARAQEMFRKKVIREDDLFNQEHLVMRLLKGKNFHTLAARLRELVLTAPARVEQLARAFVNANRPAINGILRQLDEAAAEEVLRAFVEFRLAFLRGMPMTEQELEDRLAGIRGMRQDMIDLLLARVRLWQGGLPPVRPASDGARPRPSKFLILTRRASSPVKGGREFSGNELSKVSPNSDDRSGGRWPWLQGLYDAVGQGWFGQVLAPVILESGFFVGITAIATAGFPGPLSLILLPLIPFLAHLWVYTRDWHSFGARHAFTAKDAAGLPVASRAVLARDFMPRASGDPKDRPLITAREYYRNSLMALSTAGPLARYLATGNDPQTYARIYAAMRSRVDSVRGLSIFEIGTAQGVFLFQLKQEGALVSGVEMNGELADYAGREGKMEVATANVLSPSWPLSRRTFDVTLSRNLLDALVSPGPRYGRDQPLLPGDARRLAEVIFRITRPGGWSIHQTIDEPRMRTQDFLDAGFELTEGSVESRFVVFRRPVGPDNFSSSPVKGGREFSGNGLSKVSPNNLVRIVKGLFRRGI